MLGRLGEAVRLKWPNDIYALSEEGYRKIGGILVNTSFGDGQITIIIGVSISTRLARNLTYVQVVDSTFLIVHLYSL